VYYYSVFLHIMVGAHERHLFLQMIMLACYVSHDRGICTPQTVFGSTQVHIGRLCLFVRMKEGMFSVNVAGSCGVPHSGAQAWVMGTAEAGSGNLLILAHADGNGTSTCAAWRSPHAA
jgi:hypothetical protein